MDADSDRPFHLAFAVDDVDEARRFYADLLGCAVGRSSQAWVDFDFFGNQITAHLLDSSGSGAPDPAQRDMPETRAVGSRAEETRRPVDGDQVPVPHFGAILSWQAWHELVERLERQAIDFLIAPRVRFRGQVGEQATFFLRDPYGNALEFKAFQDPARVFAH